MYPLIREIFFALSRDDAEKAHELALRAINRVQNVPALIRFISWWHDANRNPKPYEFCGIMHPNRVGIAAGLDKQGQMLPFLQALGPGFISVGSILPRSQPGNPRPRLFRIEESEALINRFGFNSLGAEAVRNNVAAVRTQINRPLWGSLGKMKETPLEEAQKDYCETMEMLWELFQVFVANISSPNTPDLRKLQGRVYIAKLVKAVVDKRDQLVKKHDTARKPVIVKIAPDLKTDEILTTLEGAHEGGADGIIIGNTTITRPSVNPHHRYANEAGGYSGGHLFLLAIERAQIIKHYSPKIPLVMVGGIRQFEQVRIAYDIGADLVKMLTGLVYRGPSMLSLLRQA